MYLDGQLPYGPPSTNQGATPNFDGFSALWGNTDLNPVLGTMDPSGGPNNTESTFLLPGNGPAIVSPSLATANGIVQTPIVSPGTRTRFTKLEELPNQGQSEGGECAGLSGLSAMDPETFSQHYGKPAPDSATCLKIQCGEITQEAAGMPLIVDCANFGYSGANANCKPSPATIASITPVTEDRGLPIPPTTYVIPRGDNLPCGYYGASNALTTIANQAGRGTGLGACCNSGYQFYDRQRATVADDNTALWILAAGLLVLAMSNGGGR